MSIRQQDEFIERLKKLRKRLDTQKELITEDEDEYTKISNKITKKIREDMNHLKNLKDNQIRTGIATNLNKVMSEMEIEFIRKYFDLVNSDQQVLIMIDKIFRGLKFFRRMSKQNRKDIILSSALKFCKPGEYVIRQGDVGDHMYIILRG